MVRFRLTAAICVMAIVALLLGGCMNEEASELHPEGSNFLVKFFDAEEKNVSISKAMQINPQMTLKDVIALLGAPHHDSGSAHHPLLYSWDLKDGGSLNITFIGNDFDGLWTKLHNNEFVLPDEIIEPETTKKMQCCSWRIETMPDRKRTERIKRLGTANKSYLCRNRNAGKRKKRSV